MFRVAVQSRTDTEVNFNPVDNVNTDRSMLAFWEMRRRLESHHLPLTNAFQAADYRSEL
jgi:hypothetical protein